MAFVKNAIAAKAFSRLYRHLLPSISGANLFVHCFIGEFIPSHSTFTHKEGNLPWLYELYVPYPKLLVSCNVNGSRATFQVRDTPLYLLVGVTMCKGAAWLQYYHFTALVVFYCIGQRETSDHFHISIYHQPVSRVWTIWPFSTRAPPLLLLFHFYGFYFYFPYSYFLFLLAIHYWGGGGVCHSLKYFI